MHDIEGGNVGPGSVIIVRMKDQEMTILKGNKLINGITE